MKNIPNFMLRTPLMAYLVVNCILQKLEKVTGAFMGREGRQVTGGELHLGEPGEGVDDKVPGAFVCREGRQVTGGELYLG